MRAGVATTIAGLLVVIFTAILLGVTPNLQDGPPWYVTVSGPIGGGAFVVGLVLVAGGWVLGKLDGGTGSSSRRM
jgi:hypothetical protein